MVFRRYYVTAGSIKMPVTLTNTLDCLYMGVYL